MSSRQRNQAPLSGADLRTALDTGRRGVCEVLGRAMATPTDSMPFALDDGDPDTFLLVQSGQSGRRLPKTMDNYFVPNLRRMAYNYGDEETVVLGSERRFYQAAYRYRGVDIYIIDTLQNTVLLSGGYFLFADGAVLESLEINTVNGLFFSLPVASTPAVGTTEWASIHPTLGVRLDQQSGFVPSGAPFSFIREQSFAYTTPRGDFVPPHMVGVRNIYGKFGNGLPSSSMHNAWTYFNHGGGNAFISESNPPMPYPYALPIYDLSGTYQGTLPGGIDPAYLDVPLPA